MTVEVKKCQEGMQENMETIRRHWWLFTGGEYKCTLFHVVFSCITGPDKCFQVGFHRNGVEDEVEEEVQLLLHRLKPAPQPLLHPLQLSSVPLRPHN